MPHSLPNGKVWYFSGSLNYRMWTIDIPLRSLDGLSDEEILTAIREAREEAALLALKEQAERIITALGNHCRYSRSRIRKNESSEFLKSIYRYKPRIEAKASQGEIFRQALQSFANFEQLVKETAARYKPKTKKQKHVITQRAAITGRIEKIFYAIGKRDGFHCAKCEATKNLQIDHIKPVTKEGTSDMDNLQLLCQRCNLKKRTKTIDYRQEAYQDLPLFEKP